MKSRILLVTVATLALFCSKDAVVKPEEEKEVDPLKYAASSDLIINEICASNSGVALDESNNDPDWIELYNKSNDSINLAGMGLSDDKNDIYKWKFGNVTIKPHEYMLVFASGNDISEIKPAQSDDSITLRTTTTWSDNSMGGKSTITPNEYTTILATDENGKNVVSAKINLTDNRPALDWAAAHVLVRLRRQKTSYQSDYSMYNKLEFKMTIEKDKPLQIRLTQKGYVSDGKCPAFIFKGTGKKDDIYTIPLIQGDKGLDLKNIDGLFIELPTNYITSVSFTLSRLRAYHTGYNLHTNFKLSGTDRRLYLTNPDSLVLDTVPVSTVPTDMSMGKLNGKWVLLKSATPGQENVQEYYTAISQVPISVSKGGFYDSSVNVTLQSKDSGDIHYTTDGSIPTVKSRKYTGPILIDSSTVLRFVSIKNGQLTSSVQTETFLIHESTDLPVISLIADSASLFDPDSGIYEKGPNAGDSFPYFGANFWLDKEIPVNLQFFDTDKKIKFSINAGITIMGSWSRGDAKKSFSVNFKEKYGQSELDYPLFPDFQNLRKFKKVILRNNGGNFGKAMIEDPMMQSLMDNRNADYQKYRPVVVFINGRYFGLHQLMEASNTDYVYTNYGLTGDQIDFFDAALNIKQGTSDNWNEFYDYFLTQMGREDTFSVPLKDSACEKIKEYMDVYNYMDYMAFEIYINNTDWPANNCRWWRNRDNGKWRWIIYDTDYGFGNYGFKDDAEKVDFNNLAYVLDNTTESEAYPNGTAWTFLLRALLRNDNFKADFVNRFATLIATNFEPGRVTSRIEKMADEIKGEINRDFTRWHLSPSAWPMYVTRLKDFGTARPDYMYQFIEQQPELGITGHYNLSVTTTNGSLLVNDMLVDKQNYKGRYFTGVPVRLKIVPSKGRLFTKWSDGNTENPRIINSDKDVTVEAICE